MKERILITGIGGQDGSYLAEMLCRDCDVHGVVRRSSCDNTVRLRNVMGKIELHHGDVQDVWSVARIVNEVRPTRIFNMADQDDVMYSYDTPQYSMDVTAASVVRLLQCVKDVVPQCRVFQPVSATIFGDTPAMQNERSRINPLSPYAVGKTAALYACRYYRQVLGLHVTVGIMFNHHSPRRKRGYLIDTLCGKARMVADGERDSLEIHDPDLLVDVGHAKDFMRMAIDLSSTGDFVFATGRAYSVRDLALRAMHALGCGNEIEEAKGPARPGPRHELVGDPSELLKALGHVGMEMHDARDMIDLEIRRVLCGLEA